MPFRVWLMVPAFVCVLALLLPASAFACENEAFRVGRSASLPDCRAYELVTPADKGRAQALTFSESAKAIAAENGERLSVSEATVAFGPNPSPIGIDAIFSRTPSGWQMTSAGTPSTTGRDIHMALFSPDLSSQVVDWETRLNVVETSPDITFEAGPVGAYTPVATIPREEVTEFRTSFDGSSTGFGHIFFASVDHELPLATPGEEAVAKETDPGAHNLYEWSAGQLTLVNVKANGSPLANPCGAILGAAEYPETAGGVHAVSEDGSTVFFSVPSPAPRVSGPGCEEPTRLFMRVGRGEPVEVSAPQGVSPSEFFPVRYDYATPDGSKVFFNTQTALTPDDLSNANKLFEYDTQAPEGQRLKRIASGVPSAAGVGIFNYEGLLFSEDGSTVYAESLNGSERINISRYNTSTGGSTFVATAYTPPGSQEPSYVTPNGQFFLFTSQTVLAPREVRGVGPQHHRTGPTEMYRYDSVDGSVLCVTCGEGNAPAEGDVVGPFSTVLSPTDEAPPFWTQLSDDGQRVFFQTTAQLASGDTNSTETDLTTSGGINGLDVYEWEASGAEESPGVFCRGVNGCTFLLSAGEEVGPSRFLGASVDGRDVFFESAAALAPQDTDEFPDIYDARVGGGFAASPPVVECASCQGVGSPPPLFSVPVSASFTGPGNPVSPVAVSVVKRVVKPKRCKRGFVRKKARCVKVKAARRVSVRRAAAKRGAGR
jgi:hypothetical protein